MATGVEQELHHNIADFAFSNIVQELHDLTDENKQKLIEAFQPLSYYYKDSLLAELEKPDKYRGINGKSQKLEFINRFLFEDLDEAKEKSKQSTKPSDLIETLTSQAVAIAPKVHNRIKNKDFMGLAELEKLIGLERVKLEVRKLLAFIEVSKLRKQYNLKTSQQTLHMIFKGNPGTGKTTVARLLGSILHEVGVLSSGHVIELDRSNLISKYQGDIEQKMVQYAEQAKGGILFIDEVYSLYQEGDPSDQGRQGVEVLLKVMEDRREDFICIGAGYSNEVNKFLDSNPGILSRFSIHIDFEDYTIDQLLDIATGMFEERDYVMDDFYKELLTTCLQEEKGNDHFGNARVVRNIVESAIREQSFRLFNHGKEMSEKELMTVTGDDFKYEIIRLK